MHISRTTTQSRNILTVRPLVKLNRHIKVANASEQRKTYCTDFKKISKNIIKPIDKIGKVCYNTIIAYQSGRINKIRGNHYEQEL